jgi:type III pantothenate kinase
VSHRLLAVDVGNTQITIGLFDGAVLVERWHMATRVARTGDELWVFLRQCFEAGGASLADLERVSISSVVPELTLACAHMARTRLGVEPLIIRAAMVHSLTVRYDPPESVGPDRLCGAVAACARYGTPAIVVDLGTATVFDVISKDFVYLGGLIAPGMMTAIESLHTRAALLPRVEPEFPSQLIGSNTVTAIQSGILNGAMEMVNGLLSRIMADVGPDAKVIGTGGFAALMQPHCPALQFIEPDLVLEGIRLITDEQ